MGAVTAALLALLLLLIFLVLVGFLLWKRVRDWARQTLVELAGPAVVRLLPPREALSAVLGPLYGTDYGHVLNGVLGGPGRDRGGRDVVVSRCTRARFRLESINDEICRTEATWTHEFSGIHDNHILVIFGTHDLGMADLATYERVYPIYELWKLNNEEEHDHFVDDLRAAVRIGITYLDEHGKRHRVRPRAEQGAEVRWGDYQKFVRVSEDFKRDDLRIVQFDLYDLADPDHVVRSVESLTLCASNNGVNLGYFIWSVPYPCYVRDVEFDVTGLPRDGERLVYTVVPSGGSWHQMAAQREWWMPIEHKLRLPLDSWMLPGHGVTLLWRAADGWEPRNGLRDR